MFLSKKTVVQEVVKKVLTFLLFDSNTVSEINVWEGVHCRNTVQFVSDYLSEVLAFFKVKIDGDDESKKCESRASCGTELQIIIFITIIISCNAVAS